MKKKLFYLYLFLALIITIPSVKADDSVCKSEDRIKLSKLAFNIKADYEPVLYALPPDVATAPSGGEQEELTYYRMMVDIYNIDPSLRVEVYNKNENKTYNFDYSDTKEGTLTLDAGMPIDINTYDIKVYGTAGCYSEFFRTISIITPKFNDMSTYEICDEIPDYELCQAFVTSDVNVSDIEFNKGASEYKEKQKEKNEDDDKNVPIIDFFKNNWKTIIIVGAVVIVIGAVGTVIIVRKRRRRLV